MTKYIIITASALLISISPALLSAKSIDIIVTDHNNNTKEGIKNNNFSGKYLLTENAIGACFHGFITYVCDDNMLKSDCEKLANSEFLGHGSTCEEYDM